MEDGVMDAQGLFPLNQNSEDCDQKEEGAEKVLEEVKEEDVEKAEEEEAKGSGGGGGLINNLISTLITPLSPRTEHGSGNEGFEPNEGVVAEGEKEGVVGNNGGGGGLIGNLVSNLFHQSGVVESVKEKEKEEKEEEEILVDEKIKRLKTENGANEEAGGGGGGIFHNIVSHLPASIPDDAVPTADEATFLINSLVRD